MGLKPSPISWLGVRQIHESVKIGQVFNKPEYWFRPKQLFRKVRAALHRYDNAQFVRIELPWGDRIRVSPKDAIGEALLNVGVYELATSEVAWRLVDPADHCLDIGANIGYMASLLAARSRTGQIFAFEPHPEVFEDLAANIQLFALGNRICPFQEAIGNIDGDGILFEPIKFTENRGIASLESGSRTAKLEGRRWTVRVRRLDELFSNGPSIGLAKVDVEGAQAAVFEGARGLLGQRRIRDIIWEDEGPMPSKSIAILIQYGYEVFEFGKTAFGVQHWDPLRPNPETHLDWELRSFLATCQPKRALDRLSPRGWKCLKGVTELP